MKSYILVFIFFLFFQTGSSAQSVGQYHFFSSEDIENIRKSAGSEWGKVIIDSLKIQVERRLNHSMEVPMLEGGHSHDYFCPIHNIRLSFDWNSPTAHYCRLCKRHWINVNKFNWAWVNMIHNQNLDFLNACTYLYLVNSDKRYAEFIKNLLLDYALKYPTYMLHDIRRRQVELQSGKMYGQSLDEAVFASQAARAYLRAKPIMSEKEIKQIENGYLKPCAELLMQQKSGGNWQVWHNSGIIALGVALGNDSIINVALNNPETGYYKMMNTNVRTDGWWSEGSPTYHFYPLRAMLLSADAVRCRGINLYDKKLYSMLASPATGVYADLQFPSHNDGWYGESLLVQAPLYEIASLRFKDNLFENILVEIYKTKARVSPEALLNGQDFSNIVVSTKRQSVNFPFTGVSVLCANDKTVVLKYGPHGGSHGHPDKLSISIHNGKKEIVSDLGTPAYGVPDYKRWYRRTMSHSTVLVDGKDQQFTTGKFMHFNSNKYGGAVEACCDSAYSNVRMNRSLVLKGNKLTDIFTAESIEEHVYDYVLILTERPQLKENLISAKLEGTEVYECIENVQKLMTNKTFSFVVAGSTVDIECLSEGNVEVFLGEAPGIPYSKLVNESDAQQESIVYPLIIRLKNKDLKIKSIWNLK